MIYVKDYQALNEYAAESSPSFLQQLPSMKGKPVTVFVDGGESFTGVLIEIFPDSIRLITALPSAPVSGKCAACRKRRCRFGTCTTILLCHITAITANYV